MPILALLAALAFGAFWYSMPAPRADFSECGGPCTRRTGLVDLASKKYKKVCPKNSDTPRES